jgi:hypothetical protein
LISEEVLFSLQEENYHFWRKIISICSVFSSSTLRASKAYFTAHSSRSERASFETQSSQRTANKKGRLLFFSGREIATGEKPSPSGYQAQREPRTFEPYHFSVLTFEP